MKKKNLLFILFNLGVHIGHLKQETKVTNWEKVVGNVSNISVMNLQLTVYHLRRCLFLFREIGMVNGNLLFHSTNFYLFNQNIKQYLINVIVFREKHSFLTEKWKNGCLSNYKTQVIDILNVFDTFKSDVGEKFRKKTSPKGYKQNYQMNNFFFPYVKKKKNYYIFLYWLDFLIQVIFFMKGKKIEGLNWIQEWKRISKFWRFYYYFKFYNNFFKWPDVCILINTSNRDSIISEMNRKKIPIVGCLDSNSKGESLSYYVPSNDDSYLLTLFYFRIFLNSYKKGCKKFFHLF